ncbi:MAG TPA: VWA domain-containing protein [Blastocatellia bacterium]|nr:VWA domain-containing protein [Blastocatellia bacterium]
MKAAYYLFAGLLLVLSQSALCQAQDQKKKTDQDWTVELKTVLVELRATVTDRQGRLVEGLKKEDFELLEKGRSQTISFFSEQRVGPMSISQRVNLANVAPPPRETPVRPRDPSRSLTLFVDTLHLSNENVLRVKQSLKKMIVEQITDEDAVMLVTSSGVEGIPARFVRDRSVLSHYIDRISAWGSPKASYFSPALAADVKRESQDAIEIAIKLLEAEESLNTEMMSAQGLKQMVLGRALEVLSSASFRRTSLLGTFKAAAELMSRAPGQRVMFFFSDGFSLIDSRGNTETQDLRAAISKAVRAGVVVYSINTRGLEPPVETDSARPRLTINTQGGGFDAALLGRVQSYASTSEKESRDGMNALASDTGGSAFFRTNDMNWAVRKSIEDNRIYYALAYYPSNEGEGFRDLSLKVKGHPEYQVRTQKGYLASDLGAKAKTLARTPQQRLFQALAQPLPETGLNVNAWAHHLEVDADKAQVSIQVEIDGSNLNYREKDNRGSLAIDVAGCVYDRTGRLVNSFIEKIAGSVPLENLENARHSGFVYAKRLELKPGYYQVRVGAIEPESELIGTAVSWVDVPDLSKGKPALSSILLSVNSPQKNPPEPQQWNSIKSVKAPGPLVYYLMLYNAASSTGAEFTIQSEIAQNEKIIYQSEPQSVASRMIGKDGKGIEIGGQLSLQLEPGLYELRVAVKDKSNRELRRSVDFLVEPEK